MKKLISLVSGALAALALLGACNNSDYYEGESYAYGAAIKSFSFTADSKVLARLDSVFFSIDLPSASIFNADSMPYGTSVNKLIPVISTVDYVSVLEIIETRENMTDSVHDYLKNPEDTINFENAVKLRVVSADGMTEMRYSVKVNVHQMESDSLNWNVRNRRLLPGTLDAPTEQKTTQGAENLYCLTRAGSYYSLAQCTSPAMTLSYPSMGVSASADWSSRNVEMPADAIVKSFTALGDNLYVLAGKDADAYMLYKSTDGASSWSATGTVMSYIYGAAAGELVGNRKNTDGSYSLVYAVSGRETAVPAGMPVTGTSGMVHFKAPLAEAEQSVIAGGKVASGAYAKAVWGFDGTNWARISSYNIDWLGNEPVIIPFVNFITLANFNVKLYPSLLAFGGVDANGVVNRKVYHSSDYGITWAEAPVQMQLPAEVPAVYGAQCFVYNATIATGNPSRAIKPLTEWTCPYIFMFGGVQSTGALSPFVYNVTYNRLTFKPIQ